MAKSEVDAKYISDFVEVQLKRTQKLRDRFEADFKLWQPEGFTIGPEKGEYRLVTSNRARVWADKVVAELAFGKVKLGFPLSGEEGKGERKNLSLTERAAYGLLAMADDNLRAQICPSIQPTAAWDTAIRGWLIPRVWLFEEDDTLFVDIAMFDPFNTYWARDKKGLSEVAYVQYMSKEEASDTYGVDAKENSEGLVEITTHWNREKERVVIDKEIVDSQDTWCKRVPILILPVGNNPYIQSKNYKDTIKHVGESIFARVRHIAPILSEVLSYYVTTTALGTHVPLVKEYDSTKSGGPPEFDANPFKTGASITVDVGKGQKVYELFKPTTPHDALTTYNLIQSDFSIATAPDVFYGQSPGAITAQGTAMLIHAAMASIKDGKTAMERMYSWLADEVVRQYKEGDFKDTQLQGTDSKEKPFSIKGQRDSLITDRRFVAELKVDTPQDEMTLSGMLHQYYVDGIISKQTYRDKTGQVPDTDAEQEIIDREQAEVIMEVKMYKLLKELLDEKDYLGAKAVWQKIQQTEAMNQPQPPVQPRPGGGAPAPGIPGGMTPAARMPMPTSPEDARLAQMGMLRGR